MRAGYVLADTLGYTGSGRQVMWLERGGSVYETQCVIELLAQARSYPWHRWTVASSAE